MRGIPIVNFSFKISIPPAVTVDISIKALVLLLAASVPG